MDIKLFGGYLNLENEYLSFGVITVLTVCLFILLANIIRRKIPFFRRLLMPTAVIAGLLGLVVKEVILAIWGFNIFNEITLNSIVYHMLPIAFISLCLRDRDNYSRDLTKDETKYKRVSAAKSGSLFASAYLLQGIVGIGVTAILAITIMPELNMGTGIMLALGYGQGPQQANATGFIWDMAGHMSAWGDRAARNYGLTIAALGFVWASIPGIFLVNWIAKKRGISRKRDEFQKSGDVSSYNIEGPDEVPLSESIDKFSLQVCMVGGVYFLTIMFIIGIEILFRFTGITFLIDLIPIFWGFAFIIGALLALLVKLILRRLIKSGIMHRKYPNKYMMNRISGVSFDLAITSALFLISVTTLGTLWIPVLLMTTIGGIATCLHFYFLCPIIYKDYKDEAFLGFYGCLTGTIANGMILIREIDSDFKTPAGDDLVLGSSAVIVFGFPLLLLIAQAPRQGNLWWVFLIIVVYFLSLLVFLLKDVIFKKKKVKEDLKK